MKFFHKALAILKHIIHQLNNNIVKLINFYSLKRFHVSYGKDLKLHGIVYISVLGRCNIGSHCTINSGKNQTPIGGDIISRIIVKEKGKLFIGNNVGISNSTIYCTDEINIHDNVYIGGGTKIWDTDFHSLDPYVRIYGNDNQIISKAIVIHKSVFIGGSSIILKGVTIGKNSIIGAGSVITKDIPANEVWAGNPAKYIRTVKEQK